MNSKCASRAISTSEHAGLKRISVEVGSTRYTERGPRNLRMLSKVREEEKSMVSGRSDIVQKSKGIKLEVVHLMSFVSREKCSKSGNRAGKIIHVSMVKLLKSPMQKCHQRPAIVFVVTEEQGRRSSYVRDPS